MTDNELSILVVDDEPVNLALLTAILRGNGYKVLTALNGADARKIARESMPSIILLDVMMPGEDGFETCKKLKDDGLTADIPIIFVSALNDPESRVRGLNVGGLDYISKPFYKEEVLARVRNYLKLRYAFLRIIEEQAKRLQQVQDAQQAMLIKADDLPEASFGIYYSPILEAGGDFYDVFENGVGMYGYFVADVSGHDLGASYATSALKALIRQNASPLFTPDETIKMVNLILRSIMTGGQHLTAVYASLDKNSSTLSLVNAAHLPVLFMPQQREPRWYEADSDIIGVFEGAQYNCQTIDLTGGERFFIYSDGLIESFDEMYRSREEGMAELMQYAVSTRGLLVQEAVEEIGRLMFKGGRKVEDDVLILGVDI